MKFETGRKLLSALLIVTLLLSMVSSVFAADANTRKVPGFNGKYVVSQTDYQITKGVTESKVLLNTASGDSQVACYLLTAESTADVTFKASYYGYYTAGSTPASRKEKASNMSWGMDRTTDQAANYEKATGEKVLFATNGDYYNMQTAQPLGYLVMEGNVVQTGNGIATEPYFAVLKDGSYVIRDYGTPLDDVQEAISGPFFLLRHGANVRDPGEVDPMPRNAIGLKADGTVVTCVADGRQAPYSVGLGVYDLAELLRVNGVVDAIYLDGGGSATYASVREGTDKLEVRNSPSDGPERTVASALLMVSTAKFDGNFDHASVYPKNEVYTPGSKVQLSAIGVDVAGGEAPLPEGLTWSVPENAGTVDASGLFTAKEGFTGNVTAELRSGNLVVGTTEITIADIDDIYFTGGSISLDFNADSDLGLNVRAEGREINYKDGDFDWTIVPKDEAKTASDIGTFNGNIFHSASSDSTLKADVTVSYTRLDGAVLTATINVEIGKMPVVMYDFEEDENGRQTAAHFHWGKGEPTYGVYTGEHETLEVVTSGGYPGVEPTYATFTAPYTFTGNYDTACPASGIFAANGYDFYLWPNGTLVENGCGELKIASRTEGAQVRSGDYSLELNYDYASYDGSMNANYYLRTTEMQVIEGYPTQLGVWIYAPEGTANYVIACDVGAWNGSKYATKSHFLKYDMDGKTYNINEDGIQWTGWMYCYADMTDTWAQISEEHPLIIRNGEGLFWLNYQPGKNLGGRYNGTLYFDDYRFVYGTNLDDLVNPTITSVKLNGEEIKEDGTTVIDTNAVEFAAQFFDPDSQNRTGVDPSSTTFFIDGVNIALDGDDASATTRTTLSNGSHTIKVQIADGSGNTASVTRAFTVNCADNDNPSASLSGRDIIAIGSTYDLNLTVDGTASALDATVLDLNSDFGTPTVTFADGVTGTYEYIETGYRKAKLTIHVEGEALTGAVAEISFNVPDDVDAEVDFFTYCVSSIVLTDAKENTYTDAQGLVKMTVSAYYTLDISTQLPGKECTVTVYDIDNLPAANVTVALNGSEIGKTDENGVLKTDAMSTMSAGETFVLIAYSENGRSFETKATVMDFAGQDTGVPYTIYHNAVSDPATQKNITWFANPNYTKDCSYIRVMTEASYNKYIKRGTAPDTGYTNFRASTELVAFPTSKNAARVNTITLNELTPDTLYYYWIGDGTDNNWSGKEDGTPMSFRTAKTDSTTTTFYVLGDTQMRGKVEADAEPIALLSGMLKNIAEKNVDFGIQTGDFVDNGGNYNHWEELFGVFGDSALASKDMIHVLGNHEYAGDFSGKVANSVLSLPNPDFYSVEYNDVYVAVINNSADLNKAAQWLIEDAAKTNCTWKIMTVHQPAYYTNTNGGSEKFNEILAPAADAADIDVVFSGHDHSYARTEQMTGGELDDFGCAWYICGDLGEKSRSLNYKAVDNPDFHFAMVDQTYDALALIAQTNGLTMTVTAYDANGNILDSATYDKNPCKDGHNYVWDSDRNAVVCTNGNETASVEDGWLKDKNGEDVYIENNKALTGWHQIDDIIYNFNEDGTIAEQVPFDDDCFIYDRATDRIYNRYTNEDVYEGYSGWTDDTDGGEVFIINGTFKTGWFVFGDEVYHLDEQTGYAHEFANVDDVPTTCAEAGHLTITCTCGDTYTAPQSNPAGHDPVAVTNEDGTVSYVCKNCGRVSKYDLTFIDVVDSDWFAPNVAYAVDNGLFNGRNALIFDPLTSMTRAEFVTVIWRFSGGPEYENVSKPAYDDCKENSWYTAAVNWSTKYSIVNGVGNNRFDPDGKITREQIVTILYRYAEFIKLDRSGVSADYKNMFADGKLVSDYADQAMTWAVGAGLLKGNEENKLCPQGLATRAEVATMIMRFHQMINAVD